MFKKSNPKSPFPNKSSQEIEELLSNRFNSAVKLQENLSSVVITPEEVLSLSKPTRNYLCPKSANVFGIEFTKFRVRDLSSSSEHDGPGPILIDIQKPDNYIETEEEKNDEKSGRFVRYHLHSQFLNLKNLGAQITFTVGNAHKAPKDFRMIERHYFKDQLIQSFNFNLGAALIPNSTNTIEHIYEVPDIKENLKNEMIDFPWETKSDSFYFVEGRLIMHNKAEYAYNYEG